MYTDHMGISLTVLPCMNKKRYVISYRTYKWEIVYNSNQIQTILAM